MPTCGTSPAVTSMTPSVEALYWTASAPRSVATPPRSPDPSTFRSPTTTPATPGTRSLKPSTPASGTSSSDCPPHIPKTSHDGSPTSSSTSRPRSRMSGVSGRVSVPQRRDAREAIYEPPDRSLWPLALVGVTRLEGEKHTLSDRCTSQGASERSFQDLGARGPTTAQSTTCCHRDHSCQTTCPIRHQRSHWSARRPLL